MENNVIHPTYLYQRETEFFGWTPISYIDSVINIVNQYIHAALDSLQDFVDAELGEVLENEQGMQKTGSLLESCVDKNFDRWELFCLQQIFYVPKDIELPIYQDLDWSVSEEDDVKMDEEIVEMRRKLAVARQTRRMACNNLKKMKEQMKLVKSYQKMFGSLPEIAAKYGISSVSNDTQALVNQLSQLIKLKKDASEYSEKLDNLSRLHKKKQLRLADSAADVSDPVKEDELYEKLMKTIPLASIENINTANKA